MNNRHGTRTANAAVIFLTVDEFASILTELAFRTGNNIPQPGAPRNVGKL
jgi:hypothetical protein